LTAFTRLQKLQRSIPIERLASQVRWNRIPLMDRWLVKELLGPLLFGIAAFTAVSLSVGVVFELVRRVAESGLPLLAAMQVLLLRLPGFLVLAFPMATLMATLETVNSRPCAAWEFPPAAWCCRPSCYRC
jgi:hypothetical protein